MNSNSESLQQRDYNVAGILFSILLDEGLQPEEWLVQYQPFLVYAPASSSMFSVRITLDAYLEETLELLYKEDSAEEYMRFEVYQTKEQYIFLSAVTKHDPTLCRIVCSKDFTQTTIYLNHQQNAGDKQFTPKARFITESYLKILFSQNAALRHVVCLHASATAYQGKAYLFMGRSGSGKSTHSRLWRESFDGAELINDDNPVLSVDEKGNVIVNGSPWSGKTPCYKNVSYPLGGIAQIVQCPHNRMVPYPPIDGYRFLHDSAFGLTYLSAQIADGIYFTLDKIICRFTVYQLQCRADKEAALLCRKTLVP